MYGLKQGPKQWHQKFDKIVLTNDFKIHEVDKCIYSKFKNGEGIIICLYVDAMLIFCTSLQHDNDTKSFLSTHFAMKDMGLAVLILGIRIRRENNNLSLTQSYVIEKILRKFNFMIVQPCQLHLIPA